MPTFRLLFRTLCLFGATVAVSVAAHAQGAQGPGIGITASATDTDNSPVILTRLVASHSVAAPGQTIQLGWQFKLQPEWDIYWSNPGDSGLPPQLKDPSGKALTLAYPTPMVLPLPPITNYGYKNTAVTLTTSYTVPTGTHNGKQTLSFAGTFLYCHNVCLPGRVTLKLPIEIAARAVANPAYTAAPDMPKPLPGSVTASRNGNTLQLKIPDELSQEGVRFIPAAEGIINDSAPQALTGNILAIPLDTAAQTPPHQLSGLLVVNGTGYVVNAIPVTADAASLPPGGGDGQQQAAATPPQAMPTPQPGTTTGLSSALFLAFLAGLVLNLMPCVLPVLGLKLMGLIRHQHGQQRVAQTLAYTGGILATFWAFAVIIALLQKGGAQLGWGFHLQNPMFVAGLAMLMLAVALNFFDVFTLGGALTSLGARPSADPDSKHPLWHNVAIGVLAVVVATPCTVPFMGAAMAYAFTQPFAVSFMVFTALGLGLAAPFLIAVPFPRVYRWLPRPGRWMLTLRHLLGWPMLATALWLAFVFAAQMDNLILTFTLLTLGLLFALTLWIYGKKPSILTAILPLLVLVALPFALKKPEHPMAWQPWSQAAVQQALAAQHPVFVDFTADWCITCKVTELTVLNDKNVKNLFNRYDTTLLRGDWTTQNPDITQELSRHNRKGVPLYLLYLPGSTQPLVLPQILTYHALKNAFNPNT